jgi:glycerol-3-phosphate dehydrogenase (NAD(P)+)
MAKISIIGAGSWGSALARILGDNNNDVLIYDIDEKIVNEINQYHTNKEKLPIGSLPLNVNATNSISEVISFSDIVVLSVPTKVLRIVLKEIAEVIDSPKLFINTSKGIEPATFLRVSEVVKQEINNNYIKEFVALTGPSHAEEVIKQQLTIVCSVCETNEYAVLVQQLFNNPHYFRVYTSSDLIGAEICGALKNIYAIASGMLYGLGLGDNARAGLISRALVEMKRFCLFANAKEDTVFGLTGLGDLVVTTTSHHSRNFQAGVKLATGSNLEETIASMTMVVEGARTVQAAYQKALELNIEVPIIEEVYKVIYNHKSVQNAVNDLMSRSLKKE